MWMHAVIEVLELLRKKWFTQPKGRSGKSFWHNTSTGFLRPKKEITSKRNRQTNQPTNKQTESSKNKGGKQKTQDDLEQVHTDWAMSIRQEKARVGKQSKQWAQASRSLETLLGLQRWGEMNEVAAELHKSRWLQGAGYIGEGRVRSSDYLRDFCDRFSEG